MSINIMDNSTVRLRYHLYRDVFTQMYYADLLGGEFANTYGQGMTAQDAVNSLKIRLTQLRRK